MTNLYSSSKHALGRAKKERSQISEGRVPQIATGAKRLLVALLFAVVLENNAAAQWASINYTVHPQSLFQSVECNGNGNSSWWSGYIKYTDNDAYDSGYHGVCKNTCNFQCNIWDDYAFPSTSNQADRVTFTLHDVVDDICSTSASGNVNCATYGEFSRTKMLREDAPSISNWTSIQWGAVANQTGGRHDASANTKWHYVTLPNDPII